MTLKQYLLIMSLATLMCLFAWGIVIFNIDPERDSKIGHVFFYVTLFFSLLGTISLINFALYRLVTKSDFPLFRLVQKSFRNGVTMSIIIMGLLFLRVFDILNIWTGLVLIILFLSVSFFRLSTRAHEK